MELNEKTSKSSSMATIIRATLVYILFFIPLYFFVAFGGGMLANKSFVGLYKILSDITMLILVFVPLSIPVSIIGMWVCFSRKKYSCVERFRILPTIAVILSFALMLILGV